MGGGKFNKKVAVIPFDTLITKEVFVACLQKILPELQQNDIGTNGGTNNLSAGTDNNDGKSDRKLSPLSEIDKHPSFICHPKDWLMKKNQRDMKK